jgi:hypothetical protein
MLKRGLRSCPAGRIWKAFDKFIIFYRFHHRVDEQDFIMKNNQNNLIIQIFDI